MARYVVADLEGTFGAGISSVAGIIATAIPTSVSREVVYEENISGFNVGSGYGGLLKPSGTLEGSLRPKQMAVIFESLFGSKSLTDYTFGAPKSLGLKISEDGLVQEFQGVGIKEMTINAEAKEIVKISAPWIAQDVATVGDITPTYTSEGPALFFNASIEIDDVPIASAKSIEIKVNGALNEDEFALGAFKLKSLKRNGFVEITGTLGFTQAELAELKRATYGSTTDTEVLASNIVDEIQLELVCKNPAGDTAFLFQMPVVVYGNTEKKISGRDIIDKSIDFRATGEAVKVSIYDV